MMTNEGQILGQSAFGNRRFQWTFRTWVRFRKTADITPKGDSG